MLTSVQETALQLLWDDDLTDEEIARQVGVCRRTLAYWKHLPEFQARWEVLTEEKLLEMQRATQAWVAQRT